MIQSVEAKNYGPIRDINLEKLGSINLFIGPNRSGKSILLKAMYCAQRTIELTGRGKNISLDKDILADKLYWTFQIEKIGNIVRKPDTGPLVFTLKENNGNKFSYSFGADTEKKIIKLENNCSPRSSNSIFIPAKEVLSLLDVIKNNREMKMEFGFDETYSDLASALTLSAKGSIPELFKEIRGRLENAINGKIVYSKEKKMWQYVQGKAAFEINATSEGTKKIAIFDTLIANHFLTKESIVFVDEPESGLHPGVLIELLDIIATLAEYGVQFMIASHSYFVIKKLYLIAQSKNLDIPVIAFDKDGYAALSNLKDGMPENAIIDESVKLYEEELCL